MINFKHVISTGYTYAQSDLCLLIAYFKSEAQKAKRNEFLDIDVFFKSLKKEIESGKKDIVLQYRKKLTKFDDTVNSCAAGKGIVLNGVIITDTNDEKLSKMLQYIESYKHDIK